MAKQTINIGSTANDGTGDPLRTAFNKINANFSELYTELGGNNLCTLLFDGNNIKATLSNDDIKLIPHGTGRVNIPGSLDVLGTAYLYNISSTGSSTLTNLTVGNTTQLNTLRLNSGQTVSEFSTDNTLGGGSTSDAKVPTQKAVKNYVENLLADTYIIEVQTDSGIIDLYDNDTFLVTGGTGITTAGNNVAKRLTLNIDNNVVVTKTDAQTLTNKTLTAPVISTISNSGTITIPTGTRTLVARDTTDTLTNKTLNAPVINNAVSISNSGTLSAGNTTINGSLSSQDLTVTGSQSVSGNITVQGTVYSDKIKSPASNANLSISAQGTGTVDVQSPMTTVAQTISGNVSVPDGFITTLGNIEVYSNTISSTTNGNINIVANGSGQIVLNAARVAAGQINAATVALSNTLDTNTLRSYSSNADIAVEPQGTGTVNFKVPTQSTVGSAGAASALPATPTGYIEFKINGTAYVIPYYAKS